MAKVPSLIIITHTNKSSSLIHSPVVSKPQDSLSRNIRDASKARADSLSLEPSGPPLHSEQKLTVEDRLVAKINSLGSLLFMVISTVLLVGVVRHSAAR